MGVFTGEERDLYPKTVFFFIGIFIQVNSLYLCNSIYRRFPGVRPKPQSIKHNYSGTAHRWVVSERKMED